MSRKQWLPIAASAIVITLTALGAMWARQAPATPAAGGAAQPASPDEAAIRDVAVIFTKAFNAGDAKAVAALWTKEGELIDADGEELKGRDAIEKDYAEFFRNNPKATITVTNQSLRFLGKNAALAEGATQVQLPAAKSSGTSRYSVLYVREDDGWRMASVREWVPDESEHASLSDLAWLVGTWTAKGPEAELQITYAWDEDKTTIRGRFVVTKKGQVENAGSQILGKDPARGIRAWVFDKNGSYGESFWWRDEGKWIIQASGALPNGSEISAMNILVPIDNNTFTWQSVDRVVAGSDLPDVAPVRVTRVKGGS